MTELLQSELFRYTYGVLAMICATGFIAGLYAHWEDLTTGERVISFCLITEHLALTYAAYTAISLSFPPTMVGVLLTMTMSGIITGFALWFHDEHRDHHRSQRGTA